MHAYWEQLQQLVSAGTPFVAVTLVDVVASAPANAGSKMLVTAQGLCCGSIGGGKIELKAIAEARSRLAGGRWSAGEDPDSPGASPMASHRFVEWNLQTDVGMTCGGVVRLYFEAYNVATWPIVIFGAGHCAQALVRLLLTMQCHLTVIDPRPEWLEKLPRDPRLRAVHAERPMAEFVRDLPAQAFVLMMTMGHASDQPILLEILKTRRDPPFPYVGVIGSEAKAAALRRGLIAGGLSAEEAAPGTHYLCPVGLPLGTNDPAEIAVSIAAQLLQRRDAK